MDYIPMAGTFARKRNDRPDSWYRSGSPFDVQMKAHGHTRVDQDGDPETPDVGYWDGRVGGMLYQQFLPWVDHREAWHSQIEPIMAKIIELDAAGVRELMIIAHSHAGQVLAYALAALPHLCIDIFVVTMDMPVRVGRMQRMKDVYSRALRCTAVVRWTHMYSRGGWWKSRFRWLGNRLSDVTLEGATANVPVPGGHSAVLNPPALEYWDCGVFEGVTGRPCVP